MTRSKFEKKRNYIAFSTKKNLKKRAKKRCRLWSKDKWDIKNKHIGGLNDYLYSSFELNCS